ncbi:MAG: carbon storage regulator CsrA [Clostridiales bacterium]|nr:carbon storage regulator CsrA [Clostridiales bacterium]
MLVLTRKTNECIMIGNNIKITILQCEDGKVKLGIDAPKSIKIHREEIFNDIRRENQEAYNISLDNLTEFKNL